MTTTKYKVAEEFRNGYVAALAITGCPPDATEHFRAGFEAGYKAKHHLNEAMNQHLKSKGFSEMATIRLA